MSVWADASEAPDIASHLGYPRPLAVATWRSGTAVYVAGQADGGDWQPPRWVGGPAGSRPSITLGGFFGTRVAGLYVVWRSAVRDSRIYYSFTGSDLAALTPAQPIVAEVPVVGSPVVSYPSLAAVAVSWLGADGNRYASRSPALQHDWSRARIVAQDWPTDRQAS